MPADRATAKAPAPPPRQASPTAKRDTAPARRAASPAGPPVLRLVPLAMRREEGIEDLLNSPGPGVPLPEALRRRLEASLRVDLSPVRVHTDKRAASVVDRLGARAFTFGRRIFLGRGELATDMTLMAHEAAHVVQQRGRPVVQKATEAPSPAALEREADSASAAVLRREPATVAGRTDGPAIQRQERLGTIEDGPAKEEEDEGWLESRIWSMLGSFGRELREISRKGIVGYLLDHIKNGLQALVDRLFEPIRPLLTAIAWVRGQFGTALDGMREAAAQIAKNDCSAVTKAVERIQEIANLILTAVKEKLEAATAKVKDFFSRLWDKFGAPIWETLKEVGGAIWERIQQLGAWIWEKTQPVRDWLSRAWTWVKNKLGVGEGEEGQNGLLQWVQRKAGEAWDWLKPKIEPYKKPLLVAAGIALMFSPAGPFLAAAAGIAGFVKAVQVLRQTFGAKNGIVDQRSVLERTVLPALKGAADKVAAGLKSAAGAVSEQLGGIVGTLGEAAGSLAGSVVSFLSRAVEWVHEQVQSLASWANQQLSVLAERISDGLDRLKAFVQPVLDFLGEVAAVAKDILALPGVIVGKLWKKIPACVRDPFVNFFIEQILKRIPLFKTVTETIPAIWNEIKATALLVIQKVFKEGDLKGAALEVLRLVLKALGVPLELFTAIFEKTGALLDRIVDDPGKFLGNLLRALKEGVIGFGSRILEHLLGGLTDWLLSQLKDANVTPPDDFSLKGIFLFVLDILGLNFEMVLGRLEKKNKPAAEAIRKTVKVLSEVWSWISTLLNEGPEGVWKRLREKVSDLWGALIASASEWIVTRVAAKALAKIATLAAAPVGTIIQGLILIYDTMRAIARYLKQMLEIINSVLDMGLDLAAGVVEGAAKLVERLLQKALGLAIGFLAQYAGLGDLGKKIAEIIGTIREKIVEAVDWLLDKAIAAMKGLIGLVKTGVGKLLDWWKAKEPFHDGQASHDVAFKGEGATAELVVQSTPEILEDYLTRTKITDPAKLKDIRKYKKEIDDIKDRTKGGFGKDDGEKIQKALIEIAKLLGKKIPESKIDFKSIKVPGFKGEVGSVMSADTLSLKSSTYAGSQPYEESGLWLDVNRREGTYVRGHLLNHHVHGPGFNKNLVPIPLSTNTQMEKTFESKVKDRVLSRAEVVSYSVEAEFNRPAGRKYLPSEDLLPSALVLSAEVLGSDFKSQSKPEYPFDDKKQVRFPVDLGPDDKVGFKREHVVLQDDPAEKIQTIPGIGAVLAERIVTYRRKKPFNFFDDLKNIDRMPADVVDELKDDKFVTLYKRT